MDDGLDALLHGASIDAQLGAWEAGSPPFASLLPPVGDGEGGHGFFDMGLAPSGIMHPLHTGHLGIGTAGGLAAACQGHTPWMHDASLLNDAGAVGRHAVIGTLEFVAHWVVRLVCLACLANPALAQSGSGEALLALTAPAPIIVTLRDGRVLQGIYQPEQRSLSIAVGRSSASIVVDHRQIVHWRIAKEGEIPSPTASPAPPSEVRSPLVFDLIIRGLMRSPSVTVGHPGDNLQEQHIVAYLFHYALNETERTINRRHIVSIGSHRKDAVSISWIHESTYRDPVLQWQMTLNQRTSTSSSTSAATTIVDEKVDLNLPESFSIRMIGYIEQGGIRLAGTTQTIPTLPTPGNLQVSLQASRRLFQLVPEATSLDWRPFAIGSNRNAPIASHLHSIPSWPKAKMDLQEASKNFLSALGELQGDYQAIEDAAKQIERLNGELQTMPQTVFYDRLVKTTTGFEFVPTEAPNPNYVRTVNALEMRKRQYGYLISRLGARRSTFIEALIQLWSARDLLLLSLLANLPDSTKPDTPNNAP